MQSPNSRIVEFTTIEGRFIAIKADHVVVVGEAISPPDPRLPNPLVPHVMGTMLITQQGQQFPVAGKPADVLRMLNDALQPLNGQELKTPGGSGLELSGFARA